MKVLIVLTIATAVFAAPQEVDGDAELVPRRGGGSPSFGSFPKDAGEGGFRVVILPSWFTGIRDFTGGRRAGESPVAPQPDATPSLITNFFRNILRRFNTPTNETDAVGGFFPELPGEGDEKNVTSEVVVIDGVPMQVNTTVVQKTHEGGSVSTFVRRTITRLDEDSGAPASPDLPTDTADSENEVLNEFEHVSHHAPSRSRRWITRLLRNALWHTTSPEHITETSNHLPQPRDKIPITQELSEGRDRASEGNLIPIVGDSDIAVNYLGNLPPHNPDAEVFDADLVRESERRFFRGRAEGMSQPLRSQPMMSQPLRSQPMMSQPLRSQPMMSQPLRSQPMMSQPLRSQPMMSQPLRSQPMMSQPFRSQPMMSQPLRSQPMMSRPLRSQL